MRRCHSLDVKNRFGIKPSSYRGGGGGDDERDSSGYLEPLLVNSRDHKYLELLDTLDPRGVVAEKCIYCSRADCSGDCALATRRLARHSSDCTHKFLGVSGSNGSVKQLASKLVEPANNARSLSGDLPSSAKVVPAKNGVRKDKRLMSKKSNGVSYNQVPQSSATSLNNNDEKDVVAASTHKPLRINTIGATLLGLPRAAKRSQSFSPPCNAPSDAVVRSHSDRKSIDMAPKTGHRLANGSAAASSHRYQNVSLGDGAKLANGSAANGHVPLLAPDDLDEARESVL